MIINLEKFCIPKLHSYTRNTGRSIGWYKVSNDIKYVYDEKEHIFKILSDTSRPFLILFVPYTTGKYEEEEKYRLNIEGNICKVYYQGTKYINPNLNWEFLKNYNI